MSNTASKYLFCFNLLYFFDLLKNKTDRLPPSSDDTHHISCNNGQLRTSTVHFMGVGKGGQGSHGPPLNFHTLTLKPPKFQNSSILEANTDSICVGPAKNFSADDLGPPAQIRRGCSVLNLPASVRRATPRAPSGKEWIYFLVQFILYRLLHYVFHNRRPTRQLKLRIPVATVELRCFFTL